MIFWKKLMTPFDVSVLLLILNFFLTFRPNIVYAWETDAYLFSTIRNCHIVRSCWLAHRRNHEIMCLSVQFLNDIQFDFAVADIMLISLLVGLTCLLCLHLWKMSFGVCFGFMSTTLALVSRLLCGIINPLTPVLAITLHGKTHRQLWHWVLHVSFASIIRCLLKRYPL